MASNFYDTVGAVSFTLLGLWWVVLQTRHKDWQASRSRRLVGYDVTLFFLFPGVMSLISLVSPETLLLWRTGFAIAALVGAASAAATLVLVRSGRLVTTHRTALLVGHVIALVLYLGVALVGITPTIVGRLGIGLRPLEVEAILLTLLLALGVNFAYMMLFEGTPEPRPD